MWGCLADNETKRVGGNCSSKPSDWVKVDRFCDRLGAGLLSGSKTHTIVGRLNSTHALAIA